MRRREKGRERLRANELEIDRQTDRQIDRQTEVKRDRQFSYISNTIKWIY